MWQVWHFWSLVFGFGSWYLVSRACERKTKDLRPKTQKHQLFSANILTRLTNVSVDFSKPRRELNSNLPWKLLPPVNKFGVGSPRNVRLEPSVPPRIGLRYGFKPARFAASIAL